MRRQAFTLIELLIVVVIIAILAAIALPNFISAQTRAKVSRVKSDLRSIATALDAYRIDANTYPPVSSTFLVTYSDRLRPITTPVAYMTSLPRDPFPRSSRNQFAGVGSDDDPTGDSYIYNTSNITFGLGTGSNSVRSSAWSLASTGPDLELRWPYYAWSENFIKTGAHLASIYDPTNGVASQGDIFRRGGSSAPAPGEARD